MDTEIYVRLNINSETVDHEQLSSAIGMDFDTVWKAGDLRARSIILEKTNGGRIESGLPKTEPLEAHIVSLLQRVAPIADNIKSLANDNTVEFSCVIYSDEVPPLCFDRTSIDAIGMLGASLDIDLYVLGESSPGDP